VNLKGLSVAKGKRNKMPGKSDGKTNPEELIKRNSRANFRVEKTPNTIEKKKAEFLGKRGHQATLRKRRPGSTNSQSKNRVLWWLVSRDRLHRGGDKKRPEPSDFYAITPDKKLRCHHKIDKTREGHPTSRYILLKQKKGPRT